MQWHVVHGFLDLPGFEASNAALVEQWVLLIFFVVFCCLMAVDRVNSLSRAEEALQLQRGFRGSIAHATCSRAEDAARIHAEIGANTEAVDYAIRVLLAAGMSTPTLRQVARAGVGIQEAGHEEISVPVLALVPFGLIAALRLLDDIVCPHPWVHVVIQSLPVACRVLLAIVIYRSSRDERCFIMKLMTRLLAVYILVSFPILVF